MIKLITPNLFLCTIEMPGRQRPDQEFHTIERLEANYLNTGLHEGTQNELK